MPPCILRTQGPDEPLSVFVLELLKESFLSFPRNALMSFVIFWELPDLDSHLLISLGSVLTTYKPETPQQVFESCKIRDSVDTHRDFCSLELVQKNPIRILLELWISWLPVKSMSFSKCCAGNRKKTPISKAVRSMHSLAQTEPLNFTRLSDLKPDMTKRVRYLEVLGTYNPIMTVLRSHLEAPEVPE